MNGDRLHQDTGPEALYNAHTTLSQVLKKVDDLVVKAYKISTETKPVGFDLIRFSEFLSAVASAVQDWVPVLEKATQKSQAMVTNQRLQMKDRRSTPYCKIRIPVETNSDSENEDLNTERQVSKKTVKFSPFSNHRVINLSSEENACDVDDSVEDNPAKPIERTLSDSPLVAGVDKFQFFTMTPTAKQQQNALYSEPSHKYPFRFKEVLRAMPSTRQSVGQIFQEASSSSCSCLDVVLHSFESPGVISSASSSPEETLVRNFTKLFNDESKLSGSDTGNHIPEPNTRQSGGESRVTITSNIVSSIKSKANKEMASNIPKTSTASNVESLSALRTPDVKKDQERLQHVLVTHADKSVPHDKDLSNASRVLSSLPKCKNHDGVLECLSGSSVMTPSVQDADVIYLSSSFKTPTFQAVDIIENTTMSPLSPSSFKTPTAESFEINDNMSISTGLPLCFQTPSFQNVEITKDVSLSTHLPSKNLVKSLTSSFSEGVVNADLSPTLLITPTSICMLKESNATLKQVCKSDCKSSIKDEDVTCDIPLQCHDFDFLNVQDPIPLSPQSFSNFSVCRTTSAELSPTLLLTPGLTKQCRAFSILEHEENEPIFELSPSKPSSNGVSSGMRASFVMSPPLREYTSQQEVNGKNPQFSFVFTPCPIPHPAPDSVNTLDSTTPLPPQSLVKRYSNFSYSDSEQYHTSMRGISEENELSVTQNSCHEVSNSSVSPSYPALQFSKSCVAVKPKLSLSVITPSTSKRCGYADVVCNSTPMPPQSLVKRYSNFFEEPKDLYSPTTIKSATTEISLSSSHSPSQSSSSTSNSPEVLSHSMEIATPMPPHSLMKRYSRFLDIEEEEDDLSKSAGLVTPMLVTSPPKTCVLMRPGLNAIQEKENLGISILQLPNSDYKTPLRTQAIVPDQVHNENASCEEDMDLTNLNKPSRNHCSQESVKITPSSDMQFSTVKKTHHSIKRTPLVDVQLSTVRKPGVPLPGEQTLKRELWTRMEAEFANMGNVCKSLFTENQMEFEQTSVENKQQCLKGHENGRQLVIPKGLQKRGFKLHS